MLAHVEREIPTNKFIEFKNKAADEIEDFSVSFIFNSELRGSGTLLDISGTLGVLTAHHVVAPTLDRDKKGTFGLNIAKHLHQFEIPRECIEHIPIGGPKKSGDYTESGPDLSFLKLSGEPILSTIKSKKRFYRVTNNPMDEFGEANLQKAPFWWVAGAPLCRSSRLPEGALVAKHLTAEIDLKALTRRGKFDYLTLDALSGESSFPKDYEGVSGGGIWFSPLVIDERDNITIDRCRLMGVAYFQKESVDGHREILAHGPISIQRVGKILNGS
jgi:hypothetical protein